MKFEFKNGMDNSTENKRSLNFYYIISYHD